MKQGRGNDITYARPIGPYFIRIVEGKKTVFKLTRHLQVILHLGRRIQTKTNSFKLKEISVLWGWKQWSRAGRQQADLKSTWNWKSQTVLSSFAILVINAQLVQKQWHTNKGVLLGLDSYQKHISLEVSWYDGNSFQIILKREAMMEDYEKQKSPGFMHKERVSGSKIILIISDHN